MPTPYPEANQVLGLLLAQVRAVLGSHFVGLYVHGSLAGGGFSAERSDIDFVVVTDGELPAEVLPLLAEMHTRITASGLRWATRLEGYYLPAGVLRRYDPAHAWHPALSVGGAFGVDGLGSDWVIQSHTLREQGIVLAGPEPRSLIDPILPDDLRLATHRVLREWWEPILRDPSRLRSREYQAYAVVTMCRILVTIEQGIVVSKPAAVAQAGTLLGERWVGLVQRALAWPAEPQPDALADTLRLIELALARSGSLTA